jgi:3-hydroxyethyl bacteriochlorophyllide a dehydrogenase
MLYDLEHSVAGRSFPLRPSAVLTGEIVQIGTVVRAVRPDLELGTRVFVKHRHNAYVECNALRDEIYAIPDDISDEDILLARQAIIGVYALQTTGVKLGASVYVIGLGIIGQLIARLSVLAGARPVIAWDRHEIRRQTAAKSSFIQAQEPGQPREREFDFVFLACETCSGIEEGLASVNWGGVVALVGGGNGMVNINLSERIFRRNVTLIGAHEVDAFSACAPGSAWRSLLELPMRFIRDGSLDLNGLITHRISPLQINNVYKNLIRDKSSCIGVVIDWRLE